jgi:hypothetical protein
MFKMKITLDRHRPVTTVNILTHLIPRYQLPFKKYTSLKNLPANCKASMNCWTEVSSSSVLLFTIRKAALTSSPSSLKDHTNHPP